MLRRTITVVSLLLMLTVTGLNAVDVGLKLMAGVSREMSGRPSVTLQIRPTFGLGVDVRVYKIFSVGVDAMFVDKSQRYRSGNTDKLQMIDLFILGKIKLPSPPGSITVFGGYDLGFLLQDLLPGWPSIDDGFVAGLNVDLIRHKKKLFFVDIRYRFKGPYLGFGYRSSFKTQTLIVTAGVRFKL